MEHCTHFTFLRQHYPHIYCCWKHQHLLTIKTANVTNQCQATTHQLCTSINTHRHTAKPSRDYTTCTRRRKSEKMAANSARRAAGGYTAKQCSSLHTGASGAHALQPGSLLRVNRSSVSRIILSPETKTRLISAAKVMEPFCKRWQIIEALTRLHSGLCMVISEKYLCWLYRKWDSITRAFRIRKREWRVWRSRPPVT